MGWMPPRRHRCAFWAGGPDEGFGIDVCLRDEAVVATCRSMIDRNTPRLRRWRVSLAKKPSTALSQDLGRGEVEPPKGKPRQPLSHLWMFLGRLIVEDGVDHFSHRDLLISMCYPLVPAPGAHRRRRH